MTYFENRREFLATIAGLLLTPSLLSALDTDSLKTADSTADRDIQKILLDLPGAASSLDRLKAACAKYANVFPVSFNFAARIEAIESGYNPDAISASYAVGAAQLMHPTARELGAKMPDAIEFKPQDDVLVMRRKSGTKWSDAIAAFRKGDDKLANRLRIEARSQATKLEKQQERVMGDFKTRMFAMTPEARRAYDARFDPAVADDMLVHYLANLSRLFKNEFSLTNDSHIQILAAVAYNAGPGNVKRKPGIPVVTENVDYVNKLMLFQKIKL